MYILQEYKFTEKGAFIKNIGDHEDLNIIKGAYNKYLREAENLKESIVLRIVDDKGKIILIGRTKV